MSSSLTRLIAYYGFKGGLGRTVTATATALFFAQQGKRVLLIDCDLEAPGLTLSAPFKELVGHQPGLLEYLCQPESEPLPQWQVVSRDSARIRSDGELWVLGAGQVVGPGSPEYTARLDVLAQGALAKVSTPVERWMQLVEKLCIEKVGRFDLVILDLRTGLSLLSDVMFSTCAIGVVMMGLNLQNRTGAGLILEGLCAREKDSGPHPALALQQAQRQQRLVLVGPIPTAVSPGVLGPHWKDLRSMLEDHGLEGKHAQLRYEPDIVFTEVVEYLHKVQDLRDAEGERPLFQDLNAHVTRLRELLGWSAKDLHEELQTLLADTSAPGEGVLVRVRELVTSLYLLVTDKEGLEVLRGRLLDLNAISRSLDLVQECWSALAGLAAKGTTISPRLWYDLNTMRLYKLRWNGHGGPHKPRCLGKNPWEYASKVRAEHQRLWDERDTWQPTLREEQRIQVDLADALLIEQRWRLGASEAVETERIQQAARILLEDLPSLAPSGGAQVLTASAFTLGTAGWYLRALSHLSRLNFRADQGLDDARIRALADALLAHFEEKREGLTSGMKGWIVYARLGLALSVPDAAGRMNAARALIEFIHGTQYVTQDPAGAAYNLGVLHLHLGDQGSAVQAMREAIRRYPAYQYVVEYDEDLNAEIRAAVAVPDPVEHNLKA